MNAFTATSPIGELRNDTPGITAAAAAGDASAQWLAGLPSLAKLDVTTFYGILKFDSRGLNVYKPMVVNQIQNGKLVTVWPRGLAQAPARYPTPPWGKR